MYILYIYEKKIVLSLSKIDTLNFTVYILTILTWSSKTYVIQLHSLISMNIFFTERSVFIVNRRRKQINCLTKRIIRSSRSLIFFKMGFLKNFLTCKGKHQCATLSKKRLQHKYFPVNITKFVRLPLVAASK